MNNKNEFDDLVNRIYFHSSREFPNKKMKDDALEAMKILWNEDNILILNKKFSNEEIRKNISNKMMAEHLETAIDLYTKIYCKKGVELLSFLIFREILTGNQIADLMFDYDLKVGNIKRGDIV